MNTDERRIENAVRIIAKTNSIRKITRNRFGVNSQTDPAKSYLVTRLPNTDIWTCECPDFYYRLSKADDEHCKHIKSVIISQDRINAECKIEKVERPQICPRCSSTTIKKIGFRKLKDGTRRQKHQCKQCRRKFILGENGFSKVSSDPTIISESLNLVMSGMSYRNIARHIHSTRHIKISHVSVLNWVAKYTQLIKEYLESFYPELSGVWSLDEMVLNVKDTEKTGNGFYDWLWNIIDPKTKFLIATEVSKRREIKDARSVIASGKKAVSRNPSYILTDSLASYLAAIRKEFENRVAHVKTKSLKDGFVNRPVERYHNEIREKLKARRGLGNDESAQTFADLHQIHHNQVRSHGGLDGKTPAQAANIDLGLGDDKYLDLIKQSGTKHNFANSLGKRIEKVSIVNEGDSTKVVPKRWIERHIWIEINDILRLHGFSWLSNGKDSCWLRPGS